MYSTFPRPSMLTKCGNFGLEQKANETTTRLKFFKECGYVILKGFLNFHDHFSKEHEHEKLKDAIKGHNLLIFMLIKSMQ
jgi:hypothetical protein